MSDINTIKEIIEQLKAMPMNATDASTKALTEALSGQLIDVTQQIGDLSGTAIGVQINQTIDNYALSVEIRSLFEQLREELQGHGKLPISGLHAQTERQIFISYSRVNRDVALELRQKLIDLGFKVWRDIEDIQNGEKFWPDIQKAILDSDTLIMCVSPESLASKYVNQERDFAREQGKRVMLMTATDIDFKTVPRWLQERDCADFRPGVKDADLVWARFINRLNTPYEPHKVLFMVEPLPPDFVPRPAKFEPLVNVLAGATHGAVAISAALIGTGGFGKSTLARAIGHDSRVRNAFDDGILWVTLGEKVGEVDLIDRISELVDKLSEKHPEIRTLEGAADELRKAVGDAYILVIIDDVWQSAHLQPFLNLGKNAATLVTTRNNGVLPADSVKQPVDAMRGAEALELLRYGLPDGENSAMETLAKRLGEWPLLLKLANSALHNRILHDDSLGKALKWVEQSLTNKGFDFLKDVNNQSQRNHAVSVSLSISLALLDIEQKEKYEKLAIFPEDTDIPLSALRNLWNYGDSDVESICQRYSDLSLLLTFDLSRRIVRLHDVIRTYLRDTYTNELMSWNGSLINNYNPDRKLWSQIHNDGYLDSNLIYHLEQAGYNAEIHTLFNDKEWVIRRNPLYLISDFENARELLSCDPNPDLVTYFRYTLFEEVVHEGYAQYPVEALSIAFERDWIIPETLMISIFSMEGEPEAKVQKFIDTITSDNKSNKHRIRSGLRVKFSDKILSIAKYISTSNQEALPAKLELLQSLYSCLEGNARIKAQQIYWLTTFKIDGIEVMERPLNWIISEVKKETNDQIYSLAQDVLKIENLRRCIIIFTHVNNDFKDELPPDIQHEMWGQIYDRLIYNLTKPPIGYSEGELLAFALPYLPSDLQKQAARHIVGILQSISNWWHYEFCPEILTPLMPFVHASDIPVLWEGAKNGLKEETGGWAEICLINIALLSSSLPLGFRFDDGVEKIVSNEARICIQFGMIHQISIDERREQLLDLLDILLGTSIGQEISFDRAVKKVENLLSSQIIEEAWRKALEYENPSRDSRDTEKCRIVALTTLASICPSESVFKNIHAVLQIRPNLVVYPDWLNIVTILASRMEIIHQAHTIQRDIWDVILSIFIEERQDEYATHLTGAINLLQIIPKDLQPEFLEKISTAVNSVSKISVKLNLLAQYMKFVDRNQKCAIWFQLLDLSMYLPLSEGNRISYVIQTFPMVYRHLTDKQKTQIRAIDWTKPIWKNAIEPGHTDYLSNIAGYIEDGLALLVEFLPVEMREQLVNLMGIDEKPWESKGTTPLIMSIIPNVPLLEEASYFYAIFVRRSPEVLGTCNNVLERWPSETIWRAWQYLRDQYKREPSEISNDWALGNWAKKLTPFLDDRYIVKAWELTLELIFPNHWPLWDEICIELSRRLPEADAQNAWKRIEDIEKKNEHWHYGRSIKSAMAARLPVEFLRSLATNPPSKSYAEKLLTCPLPRYLQSGGPWFENIQNTDRMEYQNDTDKTVKRYDWYYIYYFVYLSIFMSHIWFWLTLPVRTTNRILSDFFDSLGQIDEQKPSIKAYLQLAFAFLLVAILWLPIQLKKFLFRIFEIRNIHGWSGGPIGFEDIVVSIMDKMGWMDQRSYFDTRIFAITSFLFHNRIVDLSHTSKIDAVNQIKQASTFAALVQLRPLIQKVGGKKLRTEIENINIAARGWWQTAITRAR